MWLLRGTFDELVDQNTKLKLLKPSTEYPYGRLKPNDPADKIVTTNKGVSRNEGIFTVSDLPDNLTSDPALIFTPQNPVSKYMVRRNERDVPPETDQKFILMNGDMIIKGTTITIINEPLFVFATSSADRDTVQDLSARARSLGIRVSRTWSHIATHYLIDEFPAVPADGKESPRYPIPWLCGLLSGAHFLSLAWLDALVKKGELPRGSGNLEETYDPPKEEDFVPSGPNPESWEPKDGRQRMFRNVRFIVLYDGDQLDKNFKKLIDAGGGVIQECRISSETALDTSAKWSQIIRKARSKRGVDEDKASTLVLIGLQAEVLQAHEDWEDIYVQGAKEMDMRIVSEEDLALAILNVDMAYVNCSLAHDLPHKPAAPLSPTSPVTAPREKFVRSTLEEESFNPAQPSHQSSSKSGGSSKQPAVQAEMQSDTVQSAGIPPVYSQNDGESIDIAPRPLPLRRRPKGIKPMKALLGFDDDSVTQELPTPSESSTTPISAPPDSITSPPPIEVEYPPQSQLPSTRLKRKLQGGSSRQARLAELLGFGADGDNAQGVGLSQAEPAYKKFKADFESSLFGGREASEGAMDVDVTDEVIEDPQPPPISSQSQSGPPASASSFGTMRQSQSASRIQTSRAKAGSKHKIMSDLDEDEVEAGPSDSHTQASKRRATSSVNVVESRSQSPPHDETLAFKASKTVSSATFVSKGKAKGGAAETGVDTAPQFLQALASMKKGKKKEDEFDREFNNLRITLPKNGPVVDLGREKERKEEMEAFDAFGKDMNLRGNFMVVVESDDILRKDGGRKESTPVAENGRPNFKKFKKKLPPRAGPLVEVFLDEAMDYGQGNTYWAKEPSPDIPIETNSIHPAPRPRGRAPAAKSAPKAPPKPRRALQVENSDNDSDVMPPPKAIPATAKGKGKAAATVQKDYEPNDSDLDFSDQEPLRRRSQRKALLKAVVEDSEEDFGSAMAAIGPDVSDSDEDARGKKSTVPSTRPTHARSRSTSQALSAVSQSTVKSKSTAKSSGIGKKRARANSDSDSDGVAFQGFTAGKKARR